MHKFFAAEVYDGRLDFNLQIPVEAESLESARTKVEQKCPPRKIGFAGKTLGHINRIVEIGHGEFQIMNRFAIHSAQGGK